MLKSGRGGSTSSTAASKLGSQVGTVDFGHRDNGGWDLFALVVYQGAVLGLPLIAKDDLAVPRSLVVRYPLGGILGSVDGLGRHLHLHFVRYTVHVGVDVAVVRDILLQEHVPVRGVLEFHVQVVRGPRATVPDRRVHAWSDVRQLRVVGGALRYFHTSVEGRIVERRGDLAQAASLVHSLRAVHDDVRLEVVEVGDVVEHRERPARCHKGTAYGTRSDLEVLYPRLALIRGRRIVGSVGALQLDRLLALDAPPFVAGLDENVAVRVKVVAGLDGLDRKGVVDVGEPAVQIVAVEVDIDLTVLLGDVESRSQIRRREGPTLLLSLER